MRRRAGRGMRRRACRGMRRRAGRGMVGRSAGRGMRTNRALYEPLLLAKCMF